MILITIAENKIDKLLLSLEYLKKIILVIKLKTNVLSGYKQKK